jgi:hypothetical protein
MAVWEKYRYLCDLDLLHGYEPNSEICIFKQGEASAIKARFKEWRGIVSHVHSNLRDGKAARLVMINGEPIVVEVYDDANPMVQCYRMSETLHEMIAHEPQCYELSANGKLRGIGEQPHNPL